MELRCFCEPLFFGEESKELSAGAVLEGQVELLIVLERGVYFDEEGMVDLD